MNYFMDITSKYVHLDFFFFKKERNRCFIIYNKNLGEGFQLFAPNSLLGFVRCSYYIL